MAFAALLTSLFPLHIQPYVELYVHWRFFTDALVFGFWHGLVPVFYAHLNLLSLTVSFMLVTTVFPFYATFCCVFKTGNATSCLTQHFTGLRNANATRDMLHMHEAIKTIAFDLVPADWLQVSGAKNNQTIFAQTRHEL